MSAAVAAAFRQLGIVVRKGFGTIEFFERRQAVFGWSFQKTTCATHQLNLPAAGQAHGVDDFQSPYLGS